MGKSTNQRRVPDEVFTEIYQRLRIFWTVGAIEEPAYILGMHLIARMARYDSLEITACWRDFISYSIVRGSEALCGPVSASAFMYLGALQQLHKVVGILSDLGQFGMEESLAEAEANNGITHHFTLRPGQGIELIGYDTIMLFCYRRECGYDEQYALDTFNHEVPAYKLPTRVKLIPPGR